MSPKTKCHCHSAHKKRSPNNSTSLQCRVCKGKHSLIRCSVFRGMNIQKRHEEVRKRNHCFNCLAHNHVQGNCTSRNRCRHCKGFHHSLLHKSTTDRTQKPLKEHQSRRDTPRSQSQSTAPSNSISLLGPLNDTVLLPTAWVQLELPDNEILEIRCLLNTGATRSTVSSALVEENRLQTFNLNDEVLCNLKLASLYDSHTVLEHTFRVTKIETKTPHTTLPSSMLSLYKNIQLADTDFNISDGIDCVLGMDTYHRLIIPGTLTKIGQPDATNTIFGYVVSGAFFK